MDKKRLRVFGWSIILALGGFLFGFDTAVISGVEKSIQQLFNLSSFWHGFTISSAFKNGSLDSILCPDACKHNAFIHETRAYAVGRKV